MSCPSGYFLNENLGRCYQDCPPGYTNTGETCYRGPDTKGMESMGCNVNEEKHGPRCYPKDGCELTSDGSLWGAPLCYTKCPPNSERTAVSTCVHKIKLSGNTHLWVVDRALDLLRASGDPQGIAIADRMNEDSIRTAWENGLWDADGSDMKDGANIHSGSHFYNGAGKDWNGNATSITTYSILGLDANATPQGHNPNAREEASYRLSQVNSSLVHGDDASASAYQFGLALHYFTDATQPMHTSGFDAMKVPLMLHPYFEFYAPFVQARTPITGMQWDKRWVSSSPDEIFYQTAVKSNSLAPDLMKTLHLSGDAGICTIEAMEGAGVYTGYCFVDDPDVDAQIDLILRDAYQSTASYLYAAFRQLGLTGAGEAQETMASELVVEPALSQLPGRYWRMPKENFYHDVTVTSDAEKFRWTNAGGVTWPLFPEHGKDVLMTDAQNPYYTGSPEIFIVRNAQGMITGLKFQGELYTRQ
jgi:hypothetical protein